MEQGHNICWDTAQVQRLIAKTFLRLSIVHTFAGENEVLESLDMSWNRLSGKAGANMIEGIRNSSRLKYANMAWNGVGDVGALAIAECLRCNHLLVELDVSCNRLTAEGVTVIAKGLDANESLKKLKVKGLLFYGLEYYNNCSLLKHLKTRIIPS